MKIASYLKTLLKVFSPQNITKRILEKSLDRYSGLETQLENPDTLLTDLGKDEGIYDLMMLDDRISFSINLKKRMILSVPFDIKPASEEIKDIEICDEVKNQLNINGDTTYEHSYNYTLASRLDNALDAMVYGHKPAEIIWTLQDSKYVVSDLKFKHSKYFDYDYDEFGELNKIVIGKDYGTNTEITGAEEIYKKFLLFIYPYDKDGNIYGDSDLKEVYEQWRSKKHIQRQRNIFLEKWGNPVPIAIYDKEAMDSAEKSDLEESLQKFQEGQYFVIPGVRDVNGELKGKFEIELLEKKSAGTTDQFERAIDQLDKQITRHLLIPDKMGFSESPGGSYNLAEQQFDILKDVICFMHDWLEGSVNKLIKLIVDFNFVGVNQYPIFEFRKMDDKIGGELLKILIETGVVDSSEKWIRKYTGIPELDEVEKKEIEERKASKPPMPIFPQQYSRFKQAKNPFKADATKKFFDSKEESFINQFNTIQTENAMDILNQIKRKKIIENKDLKALQTVKMPKTELKKMLIQFMTEIYINGKVDAIQEVEKRIDVDLKAADMKIDIEWLDRDYIKRILEKYGTLGKLTSADIAELTRIKDMGFYITGIEEEKILKDTLHIIDNGLKTGKPAFQIIADLAKTLPDTAKKNALTIARTNMASEYNTARMNFFTSDAMAPLIEAYQYQSILDDATSEFCRAHDGQIISASDPLLATITPPNHYNCRSVLVPVLLGEAVQAGEYFENYKEKYPEWNSGKNSDGEKFNVGDKSIRNPAEGFGGV